MDQWRGYDGSQLYLLWSAVALAYGSGDVMGLALQIK
jgi:hypothetical protein